jgi:RNA polymerase sigma-70 factor (ECF subfamily)
MRGKSKMTTPLVRRIQGAAIPAAPESDPALEEALEAHWSPVCKALYYLVGDWDEAQDLALETFWRLYTRPPRDLTNLGGWLHRVAINLGRNAVRARRRRQRYEEAAGALKLQRPVPVDPADEAERRENQEQVRLVLSRMRPRRAQILILRHTDHTYAEIADILGVASGSVGTMLARAEREFERRYRALEERS